MKQTLREKFQLLRSNLSLLEKQKMDFQINSALEDFFSGADFSSIVGYYGLESKKEVNILPFLESCLHAGKKVFLPRVNGERIELCEITNLDQIVAGQFGVFEPVGEVSPAVDFDLILVPGLVFSENCHRIGYGKGFYDRLLGGISGLRVGIGYDFQVISELPIEDHDVRLDMVLTEKGVYRA